MASAETVAHRLTPAEKIAMQHAGRMRGSPHFYVPRMTHPLVRDRLIKKGLLRKTIGHPLVMLGREVRAVLRTEALDAQP